ncbi:tRNA-splicing endonuclease subunit SEN15 [Yarrowia sp. B02]|nr:tRNA-splicing endonuclease subunit SEN15 [Yarrowia sp. B02]
MLAEQIKTNLVHQHLWTDVVIHNTALTDLVHGTPPKTLHPDDPEIRSEWLVPARSNDDWTIKQWDECFKAAEGVAGKDVDRMLMAIVDNDSTIVYYFVYKGLVKPRKN